MSRFVIAAAFALLLAGNDAPEDFSEIEVVGIRDPFRLTPAQLREGVAAFTANRPKLAPNSDLKFKIFGFASDSQRASLRIRLLPADGGEPFAVAIDPQGIFTLPPLNFTKTSYALQANRRTGLLTVRPLIRSPGTSDSDMRVGDLRLYCKVGWAMLRQETSIFMRGLAGAVGGACSSKRVVIFMKMESPIAQARIVASPPKPLSISANGTSFRMPVADKSIGNDDRVAIDYR
jgi:hypothetical protein